jgi:hypothetical protein
VRFPGFKVLLTIVVFAPLWLRCLRDPTLGVWIRTGGALVALGAIIDVLGFELAESWLQSIDPGFVRLSLIEGFSRERGNVVLARYRSERRERSLPAIATQLKLAGRVLFFGTIAVLMVYVIIP